MEEISGSSASCYGGRCCNQSSRRRRHPEEKSIGRGSLITLVALLILSALLPSATASSTSSQLRGKKKKNLYRGIPQHGAQRPSNPTEYDENLRRLILIASSARSHGDDEKEEARRKLVSMLDTADEVAINSEMKQQHRGLQKGSINKQNRPNRSNLTKQQRQRIKRLNAQRKKKNAERRKKKQMQQLLNQQSAAGAKINQKNNAKKQTDGKFTFGPPPKEKPKPQNSAGSFSAYEPGKSMADSFVDSLASSFVSGGGGDTIQEASAGTTSSSYTISQGSLVSSLPDTSIQIDGFEKASKLDWSFSKTYPWKVTTDVSFEGKSSVKSGLPSSSANGKSLYSNITLSLDNEDLNEVKGKAGGGAVLTFRVKATEALRWPVSAFMVTLNDKILLSPTDVESSGSAQNKWTEFSIVIDAEASSGGKYDIKFIHVANPLQLDKLPNVPVALDLHMDDVRLAPFLSRGDSLVLTTSGTRAKWRNVAGVFVATSDSISQQDGYADLTSVVYSKFGGRLKYELKTSTQGPFDDLAIFLNGKVKDAQFGQSANFDYVEVEIPKGKVEITFRHRKNPGKLTAETLDKLGAVKTDGTNRVKKIELWATGL
jgi:hypothetical protein